MMNELGITQEVFLACAEKGLDDPQDKKYFEQVIKTEDYLYFKELMLKRNTQLEQEALAIMISKQKKELAKHGKNEKEEYELALKLNELENNDISRKRLTAIQKEVAEIELAIKISKEFAEEERRRREIEDLEYQVRNIYSIKNLNIIFSKPLNFLSFTITKPNKTILIIKLLSKRNTVKAILLQ